MKIEIAFIVLFLNSVFAFAQKQTYPMLIKAGESKLVTPDSESVFVWRISQVKTYQDSINELEFARKKITLLEKENALEKEKELIFARDTTIYSNLYHHYYTLWDSTDHRLESTEIKLIRAQHSRWNIGLAGVLIGVIATLLIHK